MHFRPSGCICNVLLHGCKAGHFDAHLQRRNSPGGGHDAFTHRAVVDLMKDDPIHVVGRAPQLPSDGISDGFIISSHEAVAWRFEMGDI